tara:strand:- start:81 stop:1259 length:1179 start_codon:yes stop_codon:yes gene_type:complete
MVLLLVLSLNVIAIHGDPDTPHGLEIVDIDIDVDYETTSVYDTDNLDDTHSTILDGETINADIYPGSTVEFEFRVLNTFERPDADDDEDEVIIDDIQSSVKIEEINDGEDIEDDADLSFNLGANEESDLLRIRLEIPQLVDTGSYNVLVELEGEGNNDIIYTESWTLVLDVTKPDHDIRFNNLYLEDNSLKCGATGQVTVNIFNAGRQEENSVSIQIENDELDIEDIIENIRLGTQVDPEDDNVEDIDFEHIFEFEIPDDVDEDTYVIDATILWNDIPFNTDNVELNVEQCELGSTTTTTTTSTTSTTSTTVVDEPEVIEEDNGFEVLTGDEDNEVDVEGERNETEEDIFVSKEFSLTKSPMFLPLLVGLNLIFVIVIVGVFVLIRKPAESS